MRTPVVMVSRSRKWGHSPRDIIGENRTTEEVMDPGRSRTQDRYDQLRILGNTTDVYVGSLRLSNGGRYEQALCCRSAVAVVMRQEK